MAIIHLNFSDDINISAQIGDTAYYVPTTGDSGFTVNYSNVIEIGEITAVEDTNMKITCETTLPANLWPSGNDFILFSKDNKANMSNILGYYAEVTVRNNSKGKAEMFNMSADYFDSSK